MRLRDSAAPACHNFPPSPSPALPACEKRDLSTRNPFSWVRPFPPSKLHQSNNIFSIFNNNNNNIHSHTLPHHSPLSSTPLSSCQYRYLSSHRKRNPPALPVNRGPSSSLFQAIGSRSKKSFLPRLPFSTRTPAPYLSCEACQHIVSRPSPQLYFTIWSFHPADNPSPDPNLTATYSRNMRIGPRPL